MHLFVSLGILKLRLGKVIGLWSSVVIVEISFVSVLQRSNCNITLQST